MQEDLTVGQASIILGRHPNSLRKYTRLGLLKFYRDQSGYRRFALKDLLSFKKELGGLEKSGLTFGRKLFYLKQRAKNR